MALPLRPGLPLRTVGQVFLRIAYNTPSLAVKDMAGSEIVDGWGVAGGGGGEGGERAGDM